MLSACIICHFYIVNTAPVGRLSIHFCIKNYVHIAIDTKKALVHDSIQIIHSIFTDIHMHSCTFTFAIITTMLVYLSFFSSLAYWWREGGGTSTINKQTKTKQIPSGIGLWNTLFRHILYFLGCNFLFLLQESISTCWLVDSWWWWTHLFYLGMHQIEQSKNAKTPYHI